LFLLFGLKTLPPLHQRCRDTLANAGQQSKQVFSTLTPRPIGGTDNGEEPARRQPQQKAQGRRWTPVRHSAPFHHARDHRHPVARRYEEIVEGLAAYF